MKTEVFTQQLIVPASAIDVRRHVNNLVYLQWCLNAAESHWALKATTEIQQNYVWYVLNHNISYKASALEGDALEVQTWATFSDGVKSERFYNIFRPKDNKLLVEAKTLWCLLDGKSLRPTKIPEEIRNLFT